MIWNESAMCCVNRLAADPVHRFARGSRDAETVDVMVADRLPPKQHPKALRRKVFAVPGGTSALRKTVNCEVTAGEVVVMLSIPDVLGALVLKARHTWRIPVTGIDTSTTRRCWLARLPTLLVTVPG